MDPSDNSHAWSLPQVVGFFDEERSSAQQLYPSERFFLDRILREGISVLDVGCAQGGLAGVISERLREFSYTGIDISRAMIDRARERFPAHEFLQVEEGSFTAIAGRKFDLVVVLGILHLQECWRDVLRGAWEATGRELIYDLRETAGPSIEDRNTSFFVMDFNGGDERHSQHRLPYNIINTAEALDLAAALAPGAAISRYGYLHRVSTAARTPVQTVMTSVYCLERCSAP